MFAYFVTFTTFATIMNILIMSLSSVAIHRDYAVMALDHLSTITFFRTTLAFSAISLIFGLISMIVPHYTRSRIRSHLVYKPTAVIGLILTTFLLSWSIVGFVMAHRVGHSSMKDYLVWTSILELILVVVSSVANGLLFRTELHNATFDGNVV